MTPVRAETDAPGIEKLAQALRDAAKSRRRQGISIVDPLEKRHPLSDVVLFLLERVVEILDRGDGVAIVSVGKDLTTQQAADILNVSRQYLVRLIEDGRISCTTTGKHRRLKLTDVLSFKSRRDKQRRALLKELTAIGEEIEDPEGVRAVDELARSPDRRARLLSR